MMKISTVKLVLFTCLLTYAHATVSDTPFSCNGIWIPAPKTPWMWVLSKTPSTSDIDNSPAQVVDLDMFNTNKDLIDHIHSVGKAMICYIDSQYEPGRPDSGNFTAAVKGKGIDGWPGQYWVDIRTDLVRNIMKNRVVLAKSKGCDGIEWDDVDGYANDNGFNLQAGDQIAFNKYLANITHQLGMSVGLKNDLDQVEELEPFFDWALNEQCVEYKECDVLKAFINQGKAVFGTEYKGTAATFCPTQNAANFSWLLSKLDLDGTGTTTCCSYENPSCLWKSYTCGATPVTVAPSPTTPTTPTTTPSPTTPTTPTTTPSPTTTTPSPSPSNTPSTTPSPTTPSGSPTPTPTPSRSPSASPSPSASTTGKVLSSTTGDEKSSSVKSVAFSFVAFLVMLAVHIA